MNQKAKLETFFVQNNRFLILVKIFCPLSEAKIGHHEKMIISGHFSYYALKNY